MKGKKHFLRNLAIVLAVCMMWSTEVFAITTPTSSISSDTSGNNYTIKIKISKKKTRTYHIFSQDDPAYGTLYKSFISLHGCATCSLTTVLSGFTKTYKNYTPDKTYKKLELKVFGKKTYNKNYKKSLKAQRPVSLYGISRVLKYCKIKNKYVRKFKDSSAVKAITKHLKTGNPVIVELNNRTQKNGKFSKKTTSRWACSKHTVVLLGLTDKGKVIVADSATRKWSGKNQRVKLASMSELIKYMIPCTTSAKNCYYSSAKHDGGYILVN